MFADTGISCYFVMILLLFRTLITGMVSGSIVAFNIDFNRWHYEHQNRYWGATDPRSRKQEWRVKRNAYQPVTELCCRRSTEHGRDPVGRSMLTLLKNKVRLHVFIWPLKLFVCCWTSWTHFLLVFMSYLSTSWCFSPNESSRSVVLGKERLNLRQHNNRVKLIKHTLSF